MEKKNEKEKSSYPHPLEDSTEDVYQEMKDLLRQPNNQTMVLEFENENVSIHWGLN